MEKLVDLPNIAQLRSNVVRILGQNPGKFTLQGTNTYLVGTRPPYILIDTGEGNEAYSELLGRHLGGVSEEHGPGEMISDVVITHEHGDHFGGLPSVLSILKTLRGQNHRPKIHKCPLSNLPPVSSRLPEERAYDHGKQFRSVIDAIHEGAFTPTADGKKVYDLSDGDILSSVDGTAQLRVVHTPGHTPDSICLLLLRKSRDDAGGDGDSEVLFTADSVLGQGTAVFEDLSAYMASLTRLVGPEFGLLYGAVYPGHGPVVEDGPATIRTYIEHRLQREAQIVDALARLQASKDEGVTVWDLVKDIYKDYPENLWLPAARGVVLHLKKLEVDGRAECSGGEGVDQRWRIRVDTSLHKY